MDKAGKVLIAEPGGPAATVDAVKKLVAELDGEAAKEEEPAAEEANPTNGESAEEEKKDEEKDEEEPEKADE